MKKIKVAFLLIIFIFASNIIRAEDPWAKEDAIKLLEPDWEYKNYQIERPMIFYFLNIRELNHNIAGELELKLSYEESGEDNEWQLIGDKDFIKSIWSINLIEIESFFTERKINNDYRSWLVTMSDKEGIIYINNTFIKKECTEAVNYFRIITKPLQISFNDGKILTALRFEYKDNFGNLANVETNTWIAEESNEPIVFLKQRIKGENGDKYKYFALFMEARYLYPEMIDGKERILILNNIKGFNQLFKTDVINESRNELAFYFNGNDPGIEFLRESRGKRFDVSLFNIIDEIDYRIGFSKEIYRGKDLHISALIKNNIITDSDPYLFLGFNDNIRYSDNYQWELSFYPIVFSLDDFKGYSRGAEILLAYNKEGFEIRYKGTYWNEDFENRFQINYELSPTIAVSTLWKQIGDEENYYLGFLYKK